MNDLVAFLRERLDEDEQAERQYGGEGCDLCGHAPGRPLADIAIKRQILEDHAIEQTNAIGEDMCLVEIDVCVTCSNKHGVPCRTVRLLALPYANHHEYRKEWRP